MRAIVTFPVITFLMLVIGVGCPAIPGRVDRASYVPIPDASRRSPAVNISDGMSEAEANQLIDWMVRYNETGHVVLTEKEAMIHKEYDGLLTELRKWPVTYTDLTMKGPREPGRINQHFRSEDELKIFLGQDTRYQFSIRANEIIVLVRTRQENAKTRYAFAFYCIGESAASKPTLEILDRTSVTKDTPYVELVIFDRNFVDTLF